MRSSVGVSATLDRLSEAVALRRNVGRTASSRVHHNRNAWFRCLRKSKGRRKSSAGGRTHAQSRVIRQYDRSKGMKLLKGARVVGYLHTPYKQWQDGETRWFCCCDAPCPATRCCRRPVARASLGGRGELREHRSNWLTTQAAMERTWNNAGNRVRRLFFKSVKTSLVSSYTRPNVSCTR